MHEQRVGPVGNIGQRNYHASKMGIVSLVMAAAYKLAKYGKPSNAIAPRSNAPDDHDVWLLIPFWRVRPSGDGFDAMDPKSIAPFDGCLACEHARRITAGYSSYTAGSPLECGLRMSSA
jgi:NAD(P)-dependent dehydrogenase (short-subunit alcohol dehydrogenase family)